MVNSVTSEHRMVSQDQHVVLRVNQSLSLLLQYVDRHHESNLDQYQLLLQDSVRQKQALQISKQQAQIRLTIPGHVPMRMVQVHHVLRATLLQYKTQSVVMVFVMAMRPVIQMILLT